MLSPKPLILASKSPRRAELLRQIGEPFQVLVSDIDETPMPGETATDYVLRMAIEKAQAAEVASPALVLAADTSVIVDGEIWGKPRDRDDAAAMLAGLSNRRHQVITAIALRDDINIATAVSYTEVEFSELDSATIDNYLASGEADDKAGAYGIQGLAAKFVCSLSGSYSGVVGLPLYETAALLRAARLAAG
ncbi:MAG: Maf family protein [Spongiibacteraceae bacterium]